MPSRHAVPAAALSLLRAADTEVGRVYWHQRPGSRIRLLRIFSTREDSAYGDSECLFLVVDTCQVTTLFPGTNLWPCARCIKVAGVMNKGKPTASQLRGSP
jgi:hypothetical protein